MKPENLRDYIAVEAMAAQIKVWNSEISQNHRQVLLADWVNRYGNIPVNECIALSAYEVADAMLSVRKK